MHTHMRAHTRTRNHTYAHIRTRTQFNRCLTSSQLDKRITSAEPNTPGCSVRTPEGVGVGGSEGGEGYGGGFTVRTPGDDRKGERRNNRKTKQRDAPLRIIIVSCGIGAGTTTSDILLSIAAGGRIAAVA